MRLKLDRRRKRELNRFVSKTKDKGEFRRGTAILMRSRRRKVKDIAKELNVSIDAVERWLRNYRKIGIDGVRSKKRPGRPPKLKDKAKVMIDRILKNDPQAFGFLKGRWVVRDTAKALSRETGITISPSYVHEILNELGLAYKRPKLTVKSSDPNYRRKARKVMKYKRAAPALVKKGPGSL